MRGFAGALLLVALSVVARAQSPTGINALLNALSDPDPTIRVSAFYELRSIGLTSSDAIKVGVINLLLTENAFTDSPAPITNIGEQYATYFMDVTRAVVSLHDVRAVNALVGVINTGDLVTRALASFGLNSLDAVIGKASDSDASMRIGSAMCLREMLDMGTVTDTGKAKLVAALDVLATDSDYVVGVAAIQGLAASGGVTLSGPAKRVPIEINSREDSDERNEAKRKDAPARIDLKEDRVVRVTLLSSSTFDATSVDTSSVRFGVGQATPSSGATVEHRRRDRQDDLVLRFPTQDTGLQCGDTAGFVVGKTLTGDTIVGSDSIKIIGCEQRRDDRR